MDRTAPQRSVPVLALALAFAAATASLPGSAFGQRKRLPGPSMPQPSLHSLFPMGVGVGGTVDVTIRGTDLEGVTSLWFDHPGLRALHLKGQTFRVICATGTPPGYHDVRAVGTYGLSNPRTIVVGDRPESNETEPNNTPEAARPLALNSVVNGELSPADVDCFAVEAKKGQRLLFDLEAERIDSRLDATLRLLDPEGRELAESRDVFGTDPFLDVTIPADGRYVVKVHDLTYRGSADHTYRLTLTDGPHIDAVVPAVARAGETSTFTLLGRNLGGEPAPGLTVEGRPLERKTVTITAPAAAEPDPDCPTRGHILSSAAVRRGFEYTLTTPSGRSNPVFLATTTDPVVVEREPNDDAGHAQEVAVPSDVSGAFGAPGDQDVYRFRAARGAVFRIEVSAERIGSMADPVFVIQQVHDKGEPTELATGDDQAATPDPVRFYTGTVDAEVRWTAPADGLYQVVVSDLYSSQRGDVRLAYRLSIRPERPDFLLFLVPDSPDQPDALTLHAGGRAMAYAVAARLDGFSAPIQVEAVDLPPGVRCRPVVIPVGESTAPVVFEADESSAGALGEVRLIGRSRFGDRKDGLTYVPGATRLGPDVTRTAVGGGMIWPPSGPPAAVGKTSIPPARLTRKIPLKVIEPAPLTLNAALGSRSVTPGGLLTVDLTVARRAGFDEAVTVTPVKPPPGIQNPPPLAIPKTATTGVYALTVPANLAPGVYSLVFQGSGPYPFHKDPKGKKANVTLNEPSNPLSFVVRPAPLTVKLKPKDKTLKAGGKLEVEVATTPAAGVSGPVELALAAPAALKLSAAPITISAGRTATLTLSAAPDSPVGAAAGLAVRATVTVRGEPVDVDVPLALTIAK
jgi:hypothetical protein